VQEENGGGAEECRQRREKVPSQRSGAAVPAVEEHGEIADLLRNFMQDDGDGRREAEFGRDEVRRRNRHSVRHVVDAVPHEHEGADGTSMAAVEIVTVMPIDEFFDNERQENAEQDETKRGANFRKDVEENVREERARGETDEREQNLSKERLMQREEEDSRERCETDGENTEEYVDRCGEHERGNDGKNIA